MKRLLIITLISLVNNAVFSQDESNEVTMWVGGVVGFQSFSVENGHNETSYEFGPSIGFMLNSKMALGFNIMYQGFTHNHNDANEEIDKSTGYNFEPFYRYYSSGSNKFKFFGDALVSFGGGHTSYSDNLGNSSENNKYSTFGLAVRPGFQYWFTSKWSVSSTIGALGYGTRIDEDATIDTNGMFIDQKTSYFGLNIDFSTVNLSFIFQF